MPPSRHHTRREFLRGKGAARAWQDAAARAADHPPLATKAACGAYLLSVRRRAMACDFEVQFPADTDCHATEQAVAALDLIERLEDQMTVFRADSEVIRINHGAAERPVEVEPRLFALLELAQQLYRETGGALDATSGPLSQAWGFSRRQGRMPSEAEIEAALHRVGFDKVRLDTACRTVAFQRPGIELHLNSIGKGYALDRAGEVLDANGLTAYLIQGGRSSVLAHGCPVEGTAGGWSIGLRHPLRPERQLAELRLHDEALSTSGSATQSFRHRGRRYGHILDPRSGRPAEGVYSATVIAPTAAEADALSTAFYVMGPEQVGMYCRDRPQYRAVLVCPVEREGEVDVHTYNVDLPQCEPIP